MNITNDNLADNENNCRTEKEARITFVVLVFLLLSVLAFFSIKVIAISSISQNGFNLTIWDNTDTAGNNKYSFCNIYCSAKLKDADTWNTYFYANFTNATTGNSILDGNCTIRFNESGAWTNLQNMSYNSTYSRFQLNTSFNYKGQHYFNVNCTNSSLVINNTDSFNITNTPPWIFRAVNGYIDFNPTSTGIGGVSDTLSCNEDQLCTYNLSANVSEDDYGDVLTYSYGSGNTTLVNGTYALNSSTGILTINITNDTNSGSGKKIELTARDSDDASSTAILSVDITAVNDAPTFSNLQNRSFNISELFTYIVSATDEENNIPFTFNVTFLNCSTAVWSTRNNTNCTLFNLTYYNNTATLINFTPIRNDVGSYIINFTVTDTNNIVSPYNATTSQVVNFTVLNINSMPWFTYVCDNERNTTENSAFTCRINASDFDEPNNFTFFSNYSWFLTYTNATPSFNDSLSTYQASVLVNFTANDSMVGRWLINVILRYNSETPTRINSSVISFNISNVNDSVVLHFVNNFTAYTNVTYNIQVNASDDDLFIPDKSVYNESLTFSVNVTWINFINYQTSGNKTTAYLNFTANSTFIGNNSINISVRDANNFSIASQIFIITIFVNNAPQWNSSLNLNQSGKEDSAFPLNLSQYVSDADNDTLTFSYTNLTYFPSFSLNVNTGIISFTPNDYDVGYHLAVINVSDNKTVSQRTFNFTINNTNDISSFASYANQVATEDNLTTLSDLWIYDDDFKIPQKNFYNESLTLNVTIQGPNSTLFQFSLSTGPTPSQPNLSIYSATFTPRASDVGSYNITVNVTDISNVSTILRFNLTVNSSNDAPVLIGIINKTTAIGKIFYFDINASDEEDGSDSLTGGNLTFSITNTSGKMFFNINSTTGIINVSINASHVGIHIYNVSVNDTGNKTDSKIFRLTVYDYPYFVSVIPNNTLNAVENQTTNITIIANHSIQDNLNFSWYIQGVLRNSSTGPGNGTNSYVWFFTPNFTDETCGITKNLMLNLSNIELSNFTSWNLTINNTNSAVSFSTNIPNQSTTGTSVVLTLSDYFSDVDLNNVCVNQSVVFESILVNCSNFSRTLNSSDIIVSIINQTNSTVTPTITFSSSEQKEECFRIISFDLNSSGVKLTNITSNNFSVSISPSQSESVTTTVSGGGGGETKPVALKIIIPDPVSAYIREKIVLPIKLVNTGKTAFVDISLTAVIAKNSSLIRDVLVSFDKSHFSSLEVDQEKNVTMTVELNTDEAGLYEITINATSKIPVYSDWGKMYLNVKKRNATEFQEIVIFAEELIVSNPECVELTELINEAKKLYEIGNAEKAIQKTNEAIDTCKYIINQRTKPVYVSSNIQNRIFLYFMISVIVAFLFIVAFHVFRSIISNRKV